MDNKSGVRMTRASSKSPGRSKKPAPKSKSPAKRARSPAKSPGRGRPKKSPKSPARTNPSPSRGRPKKSPSRKPSPARKASPKRKASPARKVSPVLKLSQSKKISPEAFPANSAKTIESNLDAFVRLERKEVKTPAKTLETTLESLKNEGHAGDIEVLFIDDNIRYKTSPSSVKYRGQLNVGDIREVKWEDGNYYDARILSLMEIARDRSVSLPKASTSFSQVYSTESSLIRRSSRLKQSVELDKITNVFNTETEKILKANNAPLPTKYERKYGEKPVREFGSWPGTLFSIVLLPALALVLQMSCTKSKCTRGLAGPSTNWKVYLDQQAAGLYFGYFLWQAILSALPLGRKATYSHVHARLSGFYNALLTVAVLGGLYYYGFNVTSVLSKSVSLLSTAILFGLVLALVLFVKGGRTTSGLNINADGNKLYDFFIGREVLPSVGPLSIKAMLIRLEVIGILLLDALYILKFVETHAAGVYSPTLIFAAVAHTVFVFDTLWFEEKFMTSFEAQYEGVGYMSAMAAATWPFLLTLTTRYIVYTGYEAPTYRLVICGIIFFLGYFLYRASNSQKAEFRKNPQHPVFSKYETISTFHGKRLLVGGFWGIVRHPNYVGDIVMMWSIASVCGLSHWLPYVFPALHLAVLVHRTFRVETRCKGLYGASWDRYTQLVKHRLVPRVF